MGRQKIDITGKTFGRLTVIGETEPSVQQNGKKIIMWRSLCSCGKKVICQSGDLRYGKTLSCGCWGAETRKTHGLSYDPLYNVWNDMKKRCGNANCKSFPDYGGRGIKVCERWLESFENFYEDVIKDYEKGLQLDRRDNDGDYEPSNCRWVTPQQNSMNKRGYKNSTSRYKGVSFNKLSKKWVAKIQKDGKPLHLGLYSSEKEAAQVYSKAAKELFGEYAYLGDGEIL